MFLEPAASCRSSPFPTKGSVLACNMARAHKFDFEQERFIDPHQSGTSLADWFHHDANNEKLKSKIVKP